MKHYTIALLACMCCSVFAWGADDVVQLRGIRSYGERDERKPPIVLVEPATTTSKRSEPSIQNPFGSTASPISQFVTVEFDVMSSTIPNVYARIVHCTADWREDENGFVTDISNRTSLVDWTIAAQRSKYYAYRGRIRFPNEQTAVRFSGNWKVRVYDMQDDVLIGETRFFAVEEKAQASMNFMTDFYEPTFRVSSIALTLETIVNANPGTLVDGMLQTVVLYRNNRWFEPLIVSNNVSTETNPPSSSTMTAGILNGGKVFRIARIPAQNDYRILDLTNLAMFPSNGAPVRLPLSDLRRNGSFIERGDDGALVTTFITSSDDEYVPIEFVLDPTPGGESRDDVFLVGSFNNWKPDRDWLMSYNEELRLYRLRQWVRRGRHNYMYGTGQLDVDEGSVKGLSFEEFEGNTASAGHSFLAFAYYRVQDYGTYDGIVAVAQSSIYK
ncbi:MAG: DUF5103 domain-containing protein [bacterium]|nr:DUF5103 domain-containing protein [bacterium]